MRLYDRLLAETEADRQRFINLPVVRHALERGVSKDLYRAYLIQAYHHVKWTCPLLGRALSRCDEADRTLRAALIAYIDEEKGHEDWILDDIQALGGDRDRVIAEGPSDATEVLIGYMHSAIDRHGPYALLGMVHVLEGLSVLLAQAAAESIAKGLGREAEGAGFSYLTSHGALDQDHVRFFAGLLDSINEASCQERIIATARIVYRLFADIFEDLPYRDDTGKGGLTDAA